MVITSVNCKTEIGSEFIFACDSRWKMNPKTKNLAKYESQRKRGKGKNRVAFLKKKSG